MWRRDREGDSTQMSNRSVFWYIETTPEQKEGLKESIAGDYANMSDAIRDFAAFYIWFKEALENVNVITNDYVSPKPIEILKDFARQYIRSKEKQQQ